MHWNQHVLQFVCSTDLSHCDILELWRQWEYSEQLNLAERGFQQTVVRCYGFLRAVVVTGNASQLRNLKHKKVQNSKSELTTTPKLTAFVINAHLLLTNTCLLLTWKFPDFLSYFTRLFLSSCEAAEWIRSALRWMKKILHVFQVCWSTLSFNKYTYTGWQSRFKSLQSEEDTETAQDRTVSRQNQELQPVGGYNTRSPWFWTSHEIWQHWLDENTKQNLISWACKANQVQSEVAFPKPLGMRNLLISKNELTKSPK